MIRNFSGMKKLHITACIIALVSLSACKKEATLFVLLKPSQTGVDFRNEITEHDTLNILDFEFVYNGGGVAIGDLNGDGWEDLYFTGNQVENKLYLNQGAMKFRDVTDLSGAQKRPDQWSSGVNILDINLDGREDIYVCNTISSEAESRRNLLFVNQGNTAEGIPTFKEMARQYGIDDPSHSSHAQFFDYDNDGDLDLFIGVNLIDNPYPNQYVSKVADPNAPTRDILYQNNWSDSLGHPVFKDVSIQAGIIWPGYSHSSMITDFNGDGWLDIYVANDYLSTDLAYINNKDGTFTDRLKDIFKHQAFSAMGSDIGDINNDGRPDLVTTEMQPYYNKRKKLFQSANNYNTYIYNEEYKYPYQYTRNNLQIQKGIDPNTGLPVYGDVSLIAGVEETDWSWSPLIADFDNDGWNDLIITNGFPKDVTDHDFGAFRKSITSTLVSKQELHDMIPEIKVPNFAFKNKGDLGFSDVTKEWGLKHASFSNGSAYGDLDHDGDLDLVVNNIDDPAFIFENTLNKDKKAQVNYLRVLIKGPQGNPAAFGTSIKLWTKGIPKFAQLSSQRGYLSKSENTVHFGLGDQSVLDSLEIFWAGGLRSVVRELSSNQILVLDYMDLPKASVKSLEKTASVFNNIPPSSLGLDWLHPENDFIDFNFQRTLPHKFSQYGPAIAVGDVTGDGLDDICLGGSGRFGETWFYQQKDGKFLRKEAKYKVSDNFKEEDIGLLLFDADLDLDNDLYIVRGSAQFEAGSPLYQDFLCINDGKGNFRIDTTGLPEIRSSGSVVKAIDFDGDGDLDLFRGARVLPRAYPQSDRSYLLRNDSKDKNHPVFTDVTQDLCPELAYAGMISDAIWTDFNDDGFYDLILAGEWMPLTFFVQENGKFKNVSAATGISDKIGWWNSILAADFDNDGDTDYVAGNLGQNTYFKCNAEQPIRLYAKDFDANGSIDPFISCYWNDSLGKKQEYFYHTRDDMVKQLTMIRAKYQTYGAFGAATVKEIFSPQELSGASVLMANWMYTSYVQNNGNGTFTVVPLPAMAQLAPVFGMLAYDYDGDSYQDLMLIGNDYGMELQQGRADASTGLVLKNTGKENRGFIPLNMESSHFIVKGEARALARIGLVGQNEMLLATQNRDSLKVFKPAQKIQRNIPLLPGECKVIVTLKNGNKRKVELGWGGVFLAQNSRSIGWDERVQKMEFFNSLNNITRTIN